MYRSFSDRDNVGASVVCESISSMSSPNSGGELAMVDSLMKKKAINPINGTTSIINNVIVGVNPMSHSAA